jgi:hypothetical protein
MQLGSHLEELTGKQFQFARDYADSFKQQFVLHNWPVSTKWLDHQLLLGFINPPVKTIY